MECPPVRRFLFPFIEGKLPEVGQLVYFQPGGTVGVYLPYSRRERIVRWVGRRLRMARLRRWQERTPMGLLVKVGEGEALIQVSGWVYRNLTKREE